MQSSLEHLKAENATRAREHEREQDDLAQAIANSLEDAAAATTAEQPTDVVTGEPAQADVADAETVHPVAAESTGSVPATSTEAARQPDRQAGRPQARA